MTHCIKVPRRSTGRNINQHKIEADKQSSDDDDYDDDDDVTMMMMMMMMICIVISALCKLPNP